MTLAKQLTILNGILFLGIFVGTFFISISNTRSYLTMQLESHAQNTATSLGLSLSPVIQNHDTAASKSMINAIYDRGYYQNILLTANDGTKIYERIDSVRVKGVPTWFIDLFPLTAPRAEALIMSGWSQAGKILVKSHPGYAYQELWKQVKDTFWWLLSTAILTLVLGIIAINILLKPLQKISQQAEAICNSKFPIQEQIPWTFELRRIVIAMNKMVETIKRTFADQSALTEKLREQAYQDPVTGIGNRRYFNLQLEYYTQTFEEKLSEGALLFLEVANFKAFNTKHGYQASDALLKGVAEIITEWCSTYNEYSLARVTGSNFAIILPHVLIEEVDNLAEYIVRALEKIQLTDNTETNNIANIGIARIYPGQSTNKLLAEADLALRAAQARGPNTWHRHHDVTAVLATIQGSTAWQALFKEVISKQNIVLYSQPVVKSSNGQLLHHEIFLRIPDGTGQLLSAELFMPMAIQLKLASELDKLVFDKVFALLNANPNDPTKYAVNVSVNSICDKKFVSWLCRELKKFHNQAHRIFVETSQYVVASNLDELKYFVNEVKKYGCHCGLDHVGRGFTTFGYLNSLRLSYLKIDGGFIHKLDLDKDNQFFVHSMAKVAHSVDMQIIAEAVETNFEKATLLELSIDGLQGFLIGKPNVVKA